MQNVITALSIPVDKFFDLRNIRLNRTFFMIIYDILIAC